LDLFIENKRALAKKYEQFFEQSPLKFVSEPKDCRSNYWLNAIICENINQRDTLLDISIKAGIMTRPLWEPMNHLRMFNHVPMGSLVNTEWLAERVVNLPSSVSGKEM